MKVTKKDVEKNIVELEIQIEKEKFEEAVQKSFLKNAKHFNIPGFRKGKAPRKFIEKMYGVEIFYDDAINFVLPDAYDEAVAETKIEPVDRPEVDVKQIGADVDLIVTAKVTVKPEVEISDYKGIKLDKKVYTVSDEDVSAKLTALQERGARVITVEEEKAVENGDIAVIDFEGFSDGVAFPGGKGEDFDLTIGSGQFIPGFEDQIIGHKAGEEFSVNVKFPEEYHAEDLKGKDAEFKVNLKAIKIKELPELDDEFAKDVSEFETLEELKADILKKLTEEAENRTKSEFQNKLVDAVCEKATVEIPQCMIEQSIDNEVRNFEMRLSQQGLPLDKYLEYTGMTMEDFRKQYEEMAAKQLKANLVLEKIAEIEKIEATDEDVEKEIARMAEMYNMEAEKVKEIIGAENLKKDLTAPKTVDFLEENAVVGKEE